MQYHCITIKNADKKSTCQTAAIILASTTKLR